MSEQIERDRRIELALIKYYLPPEQETEVIEKQQLTHLLQELPALTFGSKSTTLMNQIRDHLPLMNLSRKHHAILSFVDDTINKLLAATDLDYKIESLIRSHSSFLAITAIENGASAITKQDEKVQLLDILLRKYTGWSEDLGILGEKFMAPIEERMLALAKGKISNEECLNRFRAELAKSNPLFKKMENRLVSDELKNLVEYKAKKSAAMLLNKEMAGQKLPVFIIFLLQGAWYEFLQEVVIHYGTESSEWKKATNLTEVLVWSLQTRKNRDKHYKVMDKLPEQILSFSRNINPDATTMEAVLMDIREEYDSIREGSPSEPCEFQILSPGADHSMESETVGKRIKMEVGALHVGEWYLYDDVKESAEKVARIRLILNSQESERLLFTNHNRYKAMQLDYARMATYLANGTIKPLSIASTTSMIIKRHLHQILHEISGHIRKETLATENPQRVKLALLHREKRKSSRDKALLEQKTISRLKQKRSAALRRKSLQKMKSALDSVTQLRVEAWVKLPLMTGELTPCKLVAIIPGGDKYIFANRAGIKVAEYSARQLSNLLVSENSEILDTGDEFDQVLSEIIVGQRHNRTLSYAELSGEAS